MSIQQWSLKLHCLSTPRGKIFGNLDAPFHQSLLTSQQVSSQSIWMEANPSS